MKRIFSSHFICSQIQLHSTNHSDRPNDLYMSSNWFVWKFIVRSHKIWNLIGQYRSRGKVRLLVTHIFAGTKHLFLSLWGRYFIFIKHISKLPLAEVLQNSLSPKFWKIHRKIPVSESLFNQPAARCFFSKQDLNRVSFLWIFWNL